MKQRYFFLLSLIYASVFVNITKAQNHSAARIWNEAMLAGIRKDFARPVVHARNLFSFAIAVYDAWAVYDDVAETYLLGKTIENFTCPFDGISVPSDVKAAREEAISYASYRLLKHRFQYSPNADKTLPLFDSLMIQLGYDTAFVSADYSNGSPAALGNYIGKSIIDCGRQDGANEDFDYGNLFYEPVNDPLDPFKPGNPTITDPNRWQPLSGTFIDQAGNPIPISTQQFVGAEWGQITPFALTDADREEFTRDGFEYWIYYHPGSPPAIDVDNPASEESEFYKWAFTLVPVWQSHLDATDGVMWDISPNRIGNVQELPKTFEEFKNFYNFEVGGDNGIGYTVNPKTNQPYQQQIVPRGDYARVLAEFWADGPASETPPGHWFTILNYVSDHSLFEKRFKGAGPVLDDLEWDVKSYFALGGAVHDAAIACWGAKGWYDYIRPVSAIRWLGDMGQCDDPALPNYSPLGFHLIPGLVEIVQLGDPLAQDSVENIGKIKLYTWQGHDAIPDPVSTYAGAGWILAENWFPYQRPTFVTPPFAGYFSGHSTYSRSAAEVMALLTGDEYFPGGLGEFHAKKNEYLVFEDGPSMDITLQWAKYRDASDQCSLSRIWGGIHPPVDDIPGRIVGQKIGPAAFSLAEKYFNGEVTSVGKENASPSGFVLCNNYPNPFNSTTNLSFVIGHQSLVVLKVFDVLGNEIASLVNEEKEPGSYIVRFNASGLSSGIYFYTLQSESFSQTKKLTLMK